jgi:DNA modification methylase
MLKYFKILLFVFLALMYIVGGRVCIAIEINAEFEEKLERRITEVTDGLKNPEKKRTAKEPPYRSPPFAGRIKL